MEVITQQQYTRRYVSRDSASRSVARGAIANGRLGLAENSKLIHRVPGSIKREAKWRKMARRRRGRKTIVEIVSEG